MTVLLVKNLLFLYSFTNALNYHIVVKNNVVIVIFLDDKHIEDDLMANGGNLDMNLSRKAVIVMIYKICVSNYLQVLQRGNDFQPF